MKEEKMWDEKVVIRLYFFCFVWYFVIFSCICTVRNRGWGSVLLKLKQEFDSLSKDEKNNILLNLKTQYNKK